MGAPADQPEARTSRRMVTVGILIAAFGILCLGGGMALLVWRLVQPDTAVILPPGFAGTPEPTLTPGVLSAVLSPPPLPDDPEQIVILPASERLTMAPTGAHVTHTPTIRASATLSPTASLTPTAPHAPLALPTVTLTSTPSPAPTAIPAIPDRILIDAIGLDAPAAPVGQQPITLDGQLYSQWEVPNHRAAGWHQSSAPLGQPGNTVLNGHHNVYGEVFRYLVALQPGDRITLASRGRLYDYIVVQTMTLAEENQPIEVRRANAQWILPTQDERVTLITCWPYDASTHRLVVVALPQAALEEYR